jgi:hypothetical protein
MPELRMAIGTLASAARLWLPTSANSQEMLHDVIADNALSHASLFLETLAQFDDNRLVVAIAVGTAFPSTEDVHPLFPSPMDEVAECLLERFFAPRGVIGKVYRHFLFSSCQQRY